MSDFQLQTDRKAVRKIFAHCLKYTNSNVIGLIIGTQDQTNPNNNKITDAYPLFHSTVTLPMLEISFQIIQDRLKQNENIIGIYEGNVDPSQKLDLNTKILEKIGTNSLVLKVKTIDLNQDSDKDEDYYLSYGVYRFLQNHSLSFMNIQSSHDEFKQIEGDIREKRYKKLVDFDNHFEDISLDFSNKQFE